MVQLFPPRHVYFPAGSLHDCTVILLHGRGSNGPEFASELGESLTSAEKTLFEHFPSCRWVFPSARSRWSKEFEEDLSEWFDIPSLEDPNREPERQLAGLKESVEYVLRIVDEEVARLHGDSSRVILGGVSQGMAVGLIAMLCAERRLGGFVGAMGWIPLRDKVVALVDRGEKGQALEFYRWALGLSATQLQKTTASALENMATTQRPTEGMAKDLSLETPVFLSHGEDDEWVDVSLGKAAHDLLMELGSPVSWKTYTNPDGDGHWLKEPEQFDDIVDFITKRFSP
ncbi:conserved hypothetical protein [Paecilomyces variotii No. 5]|uniref:Phospholipase/carboxylesterase/thioesterase domain-containing protein n=1 Tax=Byssochlamys spectabilis (strain No. 5 / NBRC 109023) TaxID=1356009 RepID=V5G178_BYSSN|nr:conserved hypothetical protein [Paecilomyces variotii No. 5]